MGKKHQLRAFLVSNRPYYSSIYQLEARKDALRRNPDYNEYIGRLKSSGYFKGELEGSALWKEQEDKAALVFISSRREESVSPTL